MICSKICHGAFTAPKKPPPENPDDHAMLLTLDHTDYYAYTANHAPADDRDTIVFVHGAAMDHSVWSHQSRYFAYHDYNVLAVDLPGHNLSGGALLGEITDMAQWLGRIITNSVGRAFHLVGHSMGALITLEAAAGFAHERAAHKRAPLKSLTLVGFSYPMAVTPQLLEAARDDPSAAFGMMTQWSHASKIGGEPVPGFWSAGMQLSMMENSTPGAVLADLTACNNYAGGEQAFAGIRCPTLFLCGQLDRMAPAKLAKVHADKNDNAEIVLLPRCGHSLLSESPDGVLRELKRFIGGQRTA